MPATGVNLDEPANELLPKRVRQHYETLAKRIYRKLGNDLGKTTALAREFIDLKKRLDPDFSIESPEEVLLEILGDSWWRSFSSRPGVRT